jgi:hypothetical protein
MGDSKVMEDRFELVLDPHDLWMVWDKEKEEPVVFADQLLAGLSKSEAAAACEVLNEIYKRRKLEDAA